MKVVIVGGVAGGATAAARIRRLDEEAQIVVFERSGYVSYANCGLPYYLGGTIKERSALTLQTPQSFFARFRVDMRVLHEVTQICPEKRVVRVRDLRSGREFEESYDKLLLATGARPILPELSGMQDERVFTLRTVEDTLQIDEFIRKHKPASAVIAGGGFIGVETAENLRKRGLDVTIVQFMDHLMNPFDADMASWLHAEAASQGIRLLLGHAVKGFEKEGKKLKVLTDRAAPLSADLVILAMGVTPDTALAKAAGLRCGMKGGIVVNDRMQTSDPNIFAAGDAVIVKNFVTGQDALISLAGPANKQGRIAADNICGGDSRFAGSQASSVIKFFRLTAASTGINEAAAKDAGIDCDKVILSPMNHAGYYPGGTVMTMKVLYEKKTYRLLGAQIIGMDGADKRIDVLATAIRAKMRVTELKDLDLAYAPPYSSAKDPVNMAGFMAENIEKGLVKQWYAEQAEQLPRDGSVTLLDVRTREEFSCGHIDGFVNIPVDELRERMGEIDPEKTVYLICQSGLRSYIAARILGGKGFDCYNFAGGYRYYAAVKNDARIVRSAMPCGLEEDR